MQRGIHVAFVLFLVFLLFPLAKRFRHRVTWWDWLQALTALAVIGYMLLGGDAFLERSTNPNTLDTVFGILLMAAGAGGGAARFRLDHALHRACCSWSTP